MSDETILQDGPDPDVAAAELALGVLDGEERATALRRVLADPGFARDVERWRRYLAQLFDLWPEMVPSRTVYARIERSVDALGRSHEMSSPSWRYWPAATAVASAIAAALLLIIVVRPAPLPERVPVAVRVPVPVPVSGPTPAVPPPAMPDTMLAVAIEPVGRGSPVTALYDPASGALRVTETTLADAGRTAQLWVIGDDGTPHSLGLLRPNGATALDISADNRTRMAAGATLAVSLEAPGGSSTGAPEGPIVAKGIVSRV